MTFHLSPREWKNVNDVSFKQGDDKAVFLWKLVIFK